MIIKNMKILEKDKKIKRKAKTNKKKKCLIGNNNNLHN